MMLQVIVRKFDGEKWSEIETVDIRNVGEAAGRDSVVFRYVVKRLETGKACRVFHNRIDGALVLVRKALQEFEKL